MVFKNTIRYEQIIQILQMKFNSTKISETELKKQRITEILRLGSYGV